MLVEECQNDTDYIKKKITNDQINIRSLSKFGCTWILESSIMQRCSYWGSGDGGAILAYQLPLSNQSGEADYAQQIPARPPPSPRFKNLSTPLWHACCFWHFCQLLVLLYNFKAFTCIWMHFCIYQKMQSFDNLVFPLNECRKKRMWSSIHEFSNWLSKFAFNNIFNPILPYKLYILLNSKTI